MVKKWSKSDQSSNWYYTENIKCMKKMKTQTMRGIRNNKTEMVNARLYRNRVTGTFLAWNVTRHLFQESFNTPITSFLGAYAAVEEEQSGVWWLMNDRMQSIKLQRVIQYTNNIIPRCVCSYRGGVKWCVVIDELQLKNATLFWGFLEQWLWEC